MVTLFHKKKPRGVSGGANFSFLREVTANSTTGYKVLLLLDPDLLVFRVVILLASKSYE
jgi:hypothetical protein